MERESALHRVFRDWLRGGYRAGCDWSTTVSALHSARTLAYIFYFHVDVFHRRFTPPLLLPSSSLHPRVAYSTDGKLRDERREKRKPVARGYTLARRRGRGRAEKRATSRENGPFNARWNMDRLLQLACSIRCGASEGFWVGTREVLFGEEIRSRFNRRRINRYRGRAPRRYLLPCSRVMIIKRVRIRKSSSARKTETATIIWL